MARILNTVRRMVIDAMIECTCTTHLPVCLLDEHGARCGIQPFVYGSPSWS